MPLVEPAAAVCIVRDARDLIPFVCGHYLRIGFGHISFVDDGSSDGTFEFLSELSRRTDRISVRQVLFDQYRQAELMNESANALVARGYRLIVPFDADEFWNMTAADLEKLCSSSTEGVFLGRWTNFVQQTSLTTPRAFGLFRMTFHAPTLVDANRETIISFSRPFVCSSDEKVAFKTNSSLKIKLGQHLPKKTLAASRETDFEIFHLPLRYQSEITKRGLNYEPRRAGRREGPEESWQSNFHREVVLTNRTEEVWKANSANESGQLENYGQLINLIPDNRLRQILILSSIYLARTTRMLVI